MRMNEESSADGSSAASASAAASAVAEPSNSPSASPSAVKWHCEEEADDSPFQTLVPQQQQQPTQLDAQAQRRTAAAAVEEKEGTISPAATIPLAAAVTVSSPPFDCRNWLQFAWKHAHGESTSSAAELRLWLRNVCVYVLSLVPMGCLVGVFSALFLATIDVVTRERFAAPWLLFLLPVSGALQGLLYYLFARVPTGSRSFGVDFIIEAVHNPDANKGRATVPARMGWLAWIGTVLSHLCGASVGREGTGLQLASSLAASYAWVLRRGSRGRVRLGRHHSRMMVVSSMAAGFAGVFGTPFAGVIFSLEVLTGGGASLAIDAFIPCMLAAISADAVSAALLDAMGMHHTLYPVMTAESSHVRIDILLLLVLASILFGLLARVFSFGIHTGQQLYRRLFSSRLTGSGRLLPYSMILAPVLGGGLIIALVYIFRGNRDYLGIGTIRPFAGEHSHAVIISSCFASESDGGDCRQWSFLAKTLFTVVSLASGFKGGEVTCLFEMGVALGFTAAQWFGLGAEDTKLFAGAGFVAVFGAAAHTPLASTLMAVELFGGRHVIYYAVACAVAYIVSGNEGIYQAQRRPTHKMAQSSTASTSTAATTAAKNQSAIPPRNQSDAETEQMHSAEENKQQQRALTHQQQQKKQHLPKAEDSV